MKGFTREETRFSLCGLNCCLCSMYLLSRLRRRGGQSELCLRQVFPPARRHFLLLGVPGAPLLPLQGF